MKRLRVDALIIDNADLLDAFTLTRLKQTRALLDHRLALIFCARIDKAGTLNPTLATVLPTIFDTLELEPPVELAPLESSEVMGPVLLEIMAAHKITFSPDVSPALVGHMRQQFYADTQGDWKSIAVRQRRIRSLFGDSNANVRFVRQEDWEQIMGKPLVLREDE